MNAVAANPCALEEREGFEPSVLSLVRLISSRPCEQCESPKCAPPLKIILRATREECGECALLGNISPTIESGEYQPLRPVRQPCNHGRKAVNPYSNFGPNLAYLTLGPGRSCSNVFGGFARSISARSQSTPCSSTLAHWRGLRRRERSTRASSGGVGGLPGRRFGCSMRRL